MFFGQKKAGSVTAAPGRSVPSATGFAYGELVRLVESQFGAHNDIDRKIAFLTGFAVPALGVVVAQRATLAPVAIPLALEFVVVFVFGLFGLWPRSYDRVPGPDALLREPRRPAAEIQEELFANFKEAYEKNAKLLGRKLLFLRLAAVALASAVLTFGALPVLEALRFSCIVAIL